MDKNRLLATAAIAMVASSLAVPAVSPYQYQRPPKAKRTKAVRDKRNQARRARKTNRK